MESLTRDTDSMESNEICSRIFALERSIRFAGIISKDGKLLAGGMREGIVPFEDEVHAKRWYNQLTIRREMSRMFDRILGKSHYVIEEREKNKQLTIYLDNKILFVTLEPEANVYKVIDMLLSISNIIGITSSFVAPSKRGVPIE